MWCCVYACIGRMGFQNGEFISVVPHFISGIQLVILVKSGFLKFFVILLEWTSFNGFYQ